MDVVLEIVGIAFDIERTRKLLFLHFDAVPGDALDITKPFQTRLIFQPCQLGFGSGNIIHRFIRFRRLHLIDFLNHTVVRHVIIDGEHLANSPVIINRFNPVDHILNAFRMLRAECVGISRCNIPVNQLAFFDDIDLAIDAYWQIIGVLLRSLIRCLLDVEKRPQHFRPALIIRNIVNGCIKPIRKSPNGYANLFAHLLNASRHRAGDDCPDVALSQINHVIKAGKIECIGICHTFPVEDAPLEDFNLRIHILFPVKQVDESADFQIKRHKRLILVRRVVCD